MYYLSVLKYITELVLIFIKMPVTLTMYMDTSCLLKYRTLEYQMYTYCDHMALGHLT